LKRRDQSKAQKLPQG